MITDYVLKIWGLTFNWIDGAIIAVTLFYAVEGYFAGAAQALFDFCKFIVSFFLGFVFYGYIGGFISQHFPVSVGIANAIGFFIAISVTEFLLHFLLRKPFFNLGVVFHKFLRNVENIAGFVIGSLAGLMFMVILLSLFIAVPIFPIMQTSIHASTLGRLLVSQTENHLLDKQLHGVFSGAAQDTVKFLTIKPDSNAMIKLQFTADGKVDEESEKAVLVMVNQEREKQGISPLISGDQLQAVARAHAKDMLSRGYFSHYTPEGLSPFERMSRAGISYQYAGENLAFSPTVDLAMQGLMNSPGHRENILFTHFHKVGIGVLDAGIYGKMFVQEFSD